MGGRVGHNGAADTFSLLLLSVAAAAVVVVCNSCGKTTVQREENPSPSYVFILDAACAEEKLGHILLWCALVYHYSQVFLRGFSIKPRTCSEIQNECITQQGLRKCISSF